MSARSENYPKTKLDSKAHPKGTATKAMKHSLHSLHIIWTAGEPHLHTTHKYMMSGPFALQTAQTLAGLAYHTWRVQFAHCSLSLSSTDTRHGACHCRWHD